MARQIYTYYSYVTGSTTKEIGIGITFQENSVFTSTITTPQQVKNQLINYILTNPGERFFNPAFGSGIRALLFEQSVDLDSLSDTLRDNIERYVQNINVKEVNVTAGESNDINISITYSVLNITDTINVTITNETP